MANVFSGSEAGIPSTLQRPHDAARDRLAFDGETNSASTQDCCSAAPGDEALCGTISIRVTRQHTMKNVDLDLLVRELTVIAEPSGLGKSSSVLGALVVEKQRDQWTADHDARTQSAWAKCRSQRSMKPKPTMRSERNAVALEG